MTPVLLDPAVDPDPELVDHPAVVTDIEAALGLALYKTVDDTDDTSNGVEPPAAFRSLMPSTGRALAVERAQVIRDVMLRYGVPEVSIELVDGRPSIYDTWNTCKPVGVLSHHIASSPTVTNPTPGLYLVTHGRPDLEGPLCNGTAGVDLVYRIKCMGYANHPGTGGPLTLSGPLGAYTVPKDIARPYLWGTEYEGGYTNAVWDKVYTNRRTGKSMTFREFMGRCNAALVEAIWLVNGKGKTPTPGMDLSGYHGEHKTWAPDRKPDRKDYTTTSGRAEIRKYATPQEDEVSAKDVWEHKIPVYDGEEGAEAPARVVLSQAHNRAKDARKNAADAKAAADAALAQAKANRDALEALAQKMPDTLKATMLEALGEEITVSLTVDGGQEKSA